MASRANWRADELSFPVLCLSRDTSIAVAESSERLQRCNALAFFKSRYFDDLIIFDSNGAQYRVVKVAAAKPLTGIKKWLIRALNRHLFVQLTLEQERAPSLATPKEHVLMWLKKDPDFWEESRPIAEWERIVKAAPDVAGLIKLFAGNNRGSA